MQHVTSLAVELELPRDSHLPSAMSLGPFLQGALMESTDDDFAQALHTTPFNPYSQYCFQENESDTLLWRINALTDEAAERLLQPLMKRDGVQLKRFNVTLNIKKTTMETVSLKTITDLIYQGEGSAKVKLQFITPTAFKSKNDYVFMPSVRLIIQNLLMHYNQVYDNSKEIDEETIDFIEQHTRISAYNLHSRYFENVIPGGKKIPAFIGTATIYAKGAPTMVGLVTMLLSFGTYSGIGIKTSMGMGGMRWI